MKEENINWTIENISKYSNRLKCRLIFKLKENTFLCENYIS